MNPTGGDTGPARGSMLSNKDQNKAEPLEILNTRNDPVDTSELKPFTDAEFVCYMNGRKFSFVRNGDLEITLTVPWQWRDKALPLQYGFGIPLHVVIERWHPTTD